MLGWLCGAVGKSHLQMGRLVVQFPVWTDVALSYILYGAVQIKFTTRAQ